MHKLVYSLIITILTSAIVACSQPAAKIDTSTPPVKSTAEVIKSLLRSDSVSEWDVTPLMTPDGNTPLEVKSLGRLNDLFNDSNHVHWAAGEEIGIPPIRDTRGHWDNGRALEKITPCRDFYVEPLTHSSPYLVPEAAATLHEIGHRFSSRLEERTGAKYRLKVTSVLRTPESIRRLQRVNKNSVDSSVHMLATTFDISYANYVCDDPRVTHNPEKLKILLGEILSEMRDEGWIYVKFEAKQPCYHITARRRNS